LQPVVARRAGVPAGPGIGADVAWFRAMGADEVAYHQATVVGRADDHPGAALDYYGSRGETPRRWADARATRLGLAGEVTPEAYGAAFGPGGFRHPVTGDRLVGAKRPGFELVVSAHKSVAVLGVIDRADAMHGILDVETAATMGWLDAWFRERGGRRGRAQTRTATGGLTYAVTRHATSRAGDPSPHDHVLIANVVEMLDTGGGLKALDSAALRDTVEAATMVGRLHAAARAVESGFTIAPDEGPSGNLRHWRIVGIPDEVCAVFSKRADDIAEHLATTGQHSYRARGVAARLTRSVKRHTGAVELLPTWRAELAAVGWPVERLAQYLTAAQERARGLPFPLTTAEIDWLAAEVLDIDGRLLARHKVFTRTHLTAEIAPRLYGRDPAELDRVLDHIVTHHGVVPLVGVAGAREQSFTTVEVLAAEHTIAATIETLADQAGPGIDHDTVTAALRAREEAIGSPLTRGQRAAVEALCCTGRAVTVLVGVAGSGKTTVLDAATDALQASGYRVLGTSTSGQAARTLGAEANVEARTFASLLWRLDHGQATLDDRTVVVVDEAGMADDADLARLTLAIGRSRAALVLVGDHRQLAAVGPGGALAALLERRPDLVVNLDENVRQHDPDERRALAELRHGSAPNAVRWYATAGRIRVQPRRTDTLIALTKAWAADVDAGHDTALLAWRRADVADLNRLARRAWDELGRLRGDDVHVTGGRSYAIGDRVVALAPNPEAGIVTSDHLTITAVTPDRIDARTIDGRAVTLTGAGIDTDHLDYGYALTVHRAQGATYDRAHVLAAGGGRELAYVALSRARHHTAIHATGDDLAQAVDDLQGDWGVERHQRWITDTPARIGQHPDPQPPAPVPMKATTPAPQPLGTRRAETGRRLAALERAYHDLHAGTGPWHHTPQGAAARHLHTTRDQLNQARRTVAAPGTRRRDRRKAVKAIGALTVEVAQAEQRWQQIGDPIARRFAHDITATRRQLDHIELEALRQRLDGINHRTIQPRSLSVADARRRPGPTRTTPDHDLGLSL
jgi:conjugative relaxase-like TrwC/TraI family protein